jgi:pimeloyl-ACP methyl ester carboxylesterase
MSKSGFVSVPGGSLYYEEDGAGPAVVLIHAGVANLRMWDPLVASLSSRYRLIRYDTRGFGRTESEHAEFSNRADVVAVLDHAGVDKATVVGASRGGMIALDSVIEYPDRFEGLVVVAGGVGGYQPPDIEEDEALWKEAGRMEEAKEWDALADFETRFWCDGPGQPIGRVAPEIREKVHGWILDNYLAEKEGGIPQVLTPPAVGRLGEVAVPVLVLIGEFDEPFANASCRHLAETVGATLVEYPAAHMLTLEHPERFAGDLDAFLGELHG